MPTVLICRSKSHLCVNIQLKPVTTECRAARGQCDVAEYCNGTDPLCPSDVYRRNTDPCTVDGVCLYLTFILCERILQCLLLYLVHDYGQTDLSSSYDVFIIEMGRHIENIAHFCS